MPLRPVRGFRRAAAGTALLALAACSGRREPSAAAGDLAAVCEQEVKSAAAAPVRRASWRLAPGLLAGDEKEAPLGKVVGAAWHPALNRLYVLDAYRGGVTAYDENGRRVLSFGRIGGGPGEFGELGGSHGGRSVYNQLSVLGDGRIAIMELGVLHVFESDGRFVQRMRITQSDAGPHSVLQVAGFSESAALFSVTGAMDFGTDDRDQRTGLRLVRASVRGAALDTAAFGRVRNNLNRMPPFGRVPPRDPYLEYYRRVWDAVPSGLVAVPSQFVPGVCFFDARGGLLTAYRIEAEAIEVDRTERQRVINGLRERFGDKPPLGRQSWEEQVKAWPRTVPPYGDVALAPDSVAWLLRPIRGGGATVDLVHASRGYLGSIDPLEERLPLAFAGGCAYVVEERVPESLDRGPATYGLRRWCRPTNSAPTGGR